MRSRRLGDADVSVHDATVPAQVLKKTVGQVDGSETMARRHPRAAGALELGIVVATSWWLRARTVRVKPPRRLSAS